MDYSPENAVLMGSELRCYPAYGLTPAPPPGLLAATGGMEEPSIQRAIVLALDPSSTATGWATMHRCGQLIEAGLLTPTRARDSSWDRICELCDSLTDLLEQIRPATILIEWTRGKVGRHRHQGLGAGLAVYGCGVGAQAMIARMWSVAHPGTRLEPVLENDWTRGVPKSDRTAAIVATYPAYAAVAGQDAGGDIADAIGLAAWWLRESGLLFRT